MPTKLLTTQEHWDLTLPSLCARSRLYSLDPIGRGTEMVEALSSYVMRLAEAHCVKPSELLTREIASRLRKDARRKLSKASDQSILALLVLQEEVIRQVQALYWVAPTEFVSKRVEVLEQLTAQKNLRQLTLMPLGDRVLLQGSALHVTQPWCPDCYRTWREMNYPIYDPLLWSLNCVLLCPYHQQRLQFNCPRCDRTQPFLKLNAKPGHCNYCGTWLGQVSDFLLTRHCYEDLDLWIAKSVARTLAAMSVLEGKPKSKKKVQFFYRFIKQCHTDRVEPLKKLLSL